LSLISGFLASREAKKTRKSQEAANERAETKAKEAAALDRTREYTGADIIFGAAKDSDVTLRRKARKGATATSGASGSLGGFSPSVSLGRSFRVQ
jgi:hypothetical protein